MLGRITWLCVCGALVSACWAKFPDERMGQDGSALDVAQQDVTTPNPDQNVHDASTQDGLPDTATDTVAGDILQIPDGFTCTPDAFIQCVGKDLQRCNKKGDGVDLESCAPYDCNAAAGRCNECDPQSPPSCKGQNLVTCDASGLEQTTPCSQGCDGGECCVDVDQDTHTNCDGDCNDGDPKVFPGQTAWQTTASNNSFDYNCDNTEEPQYPGPVACQLNKGSCIGEGWAGATPACGAQGQLSTCKKQANQCVVDTTTTTTQSCR